jgi:hypothetical protein
MERAEFVAYVLIVAGLILLIITFIMAFLTLASVTTITTSLDLLKALGEILGPIVEAVVRVMLLGVMGWIGSIATMRGIQLYREFKSTIQAPRAEEETAEKVS